MATPESWEATTPNYGIRFPKADAPAYKLPVAFHHIADDLDAALKTADIPVVTDAPIIVAASTAARDTHWGAPTAVADQVALQNLGATTIRTDQGWTEQYYAAKSSSNPAGIDGGPAGWYPVSGRMPTLLSRGTKAGSVLSGWNQIGSLAFPDTPQVMRGGFTSTGGSWTVPLAGLYRVTAQVGTTTSPAERRSIRVAANASSYDNGTTVLGASVTSTNTVDATGLQPLSAGDVLRIYAYITSSGLTTDAGVNAPVLQLDYVGPR